MAISGEWHSFTDENIANATIMNGVYALHQGSTLIYIGKGEGAEGIRGRLKSHKAGYEGTCTKYADYFNCEICFDASARERLELDAYKAIYGKLPKCNEVLP
jgi:hypothetical protein